MLVDEARLVDDVEVPAPPFLQSERLVERQAQLAGDIVDRTGEQIRLQSSGILQDSHDNPVECGLLPPPGRVRLPRDMRPADAFDDPVRAEIEPRLERTPVCTTWVQGS